MKANMERDMINAKALSKWSTAFLGGVPHGDNYSEPNLAPSDWWKGLERIVPEVLIWGGQWEVLIDSINDFVSKFQKGYGGKCNFIVGEKGAHEQMIIDRILGYKTKSKTGADVEEWIKAKL